ncbi:hypothetical protein P3S67_018759 [Capsicum chacoense]
MNLQVSLEHCPNEVFAHLSAGKCWDMVRERANQEIANQHKLGKLKLPPLQLTAWKCLVLLHQQLHRSFKLWIKTGYVLNSGGLNH